MKVADYKDLRVYQLGFESAMDRICRQLTKMMNDPIDWCGAGSRLREDFAEYSVESTLPMEDKSTKKLSRTTFSASPRSDASRS
jgi:hypothetical protein